MTASGATQRTQLLVLLVACCASAPAVARASSIEGAYAIFGIPFMFLGAFLAAVCWAVASGSRRAAGAGFVVAVLNALMTSLMGMLLVGDLLVAGEAVFSGWMAGFRVLAFLLVLSTWAFVLYAPFAILKLQEAHRKERTARFLDELTAGDENQK